MATCCNKYKATMLREPIEFQSKTRTDDGGGGFTESWAAVTGAPTRAYVRQLSSGEQWASQRTEGRSTHMIVVRYSSAINEVMRAVIRGREYNLDPPNNVDFDDRWLEIKARRGVAV